MLEGKPRDSLVIYDPPTEVQAGYDPNDPFKRTFGGSKRAGALPPLEHKSKQEQALHAIIPPREWIENGKHMIEKASSQNAQRIDVARLREMLDQKLMERQARESGICPVREELFQQCFEEIIRQVTLEMPERGLLLMRVKRDIYSNISAYLTLYNSSVTFAMRKQLQAKHGMPDLETRKGELEGKNKKQKKKIAELEAKMEAINAIIEKKREADDKRREEEKKFLQQQSEHLKKFLKQIEQSQRQQ